MIPLLPYQKVMKVKTLCWQNLIHQMKNPTALSRGMRFLWKRAAAVHLFQVKSWDLYQSLGKISKHPGEEQSEDLPNTLNFSNFYGSGQMDKVSFHYKILPLFSVCSKHMSVVRKVTVFEYQDLENKIHSL